MAVTPRPEGLVDGYFDALDAYAQRFDRLFLTGISIGAVVSVQWALEHPDRVAGVIAALPPWTGSGAGAPAAMSAAYTAQALRDEGLEAVVAAMRGSSPQWLADLIEPAWRAQWPGLPKALEDVASYPHPTRAELRALEVPVALVGAIDDPIHPDIVCDEWSALIPRSGVAKIPLGEIGQDTARIGQSGVRVLSELGAL